MSSRRRRARRSAYLAAAAIAASAVLIMLAAGWYPLATVNGRVIWASSFRTYVASALAYQQAARDTYAATSTLLSASARGEQRLGAAALDELVEQKLLEQGLDELVGDHAGNLVDEKVGDLLTEPQLPGASRALFQLDPGSFVRIILRPQAMREVLSGRVYLDGKSLGEWVEGRRREARVRILSSSYRWDGGQVQPD